MKIFESVFDIAYLITVIGLGIKLLLERKEDYKLFAIMAIIIAKMPQKPTLVTRLLGAFCCC